MTRHDSAPGPHKPAWLEWAQLLQATAQTGLAFAHDPHDIERYQTVLKIAAELAADGAGLEQDVAAIHRFFRADKGYATPKVDVRAAVFDEGRILLVREREDGHWTLPGGWADIGSSPRVNVTREVLEESGYETEVTKLAAVYDRDLHGHPPIPFHAYKLFFISRLVGGTARHSRETDGVAFFTEGDLPPLSLTRVTPRQVRHMFEHSRHPEWPTSFD